MDTPFTSRPVARAAPSRRLAIVRRQRLAIRALVALTALSGIAILTLGVYRMADENTTRAGTPVEIDNRLHDCIHNVLDIAGQNRPEIYTYKDVWNVCAHEVFSVDQIVDFDIRREKLLRQELDERVLLWMVVAVTMSGVGLAGLQLWMSYTLAGSGIEFAQESEVTIQNRKLAFRSSVTGLMILAISLAFFAIYVKWIYPSRSVDIQGPDVSPIPAGIISGVGSVDPPAPGKAPNEHGQIPDHPAPSSGPPR